MSVTFDQITEAENHVATLQERLLKERGWEHTSATPSPCYWLWVKEINGKRYTLPQSMALSIESCVDQDETEAK